MNVASSVSSRSACATGMMHVHLVWRVLADLLIPVARPCDRGILLGFSRGSRRANSFSFSYALCRHDTREQHVSRMNSYGGLARSLSSSMAPGCRIYPPSRFPLSCPSNRPPLLPVLLFIFPRVGGYFWNTQKTTMAHGAASSRFSARSSVALPLLFLFHVSPQLTLSLSFVLYANINA